MTFAHYTIAAGATIHPHSHENDEVELIELCGGFGGAGLASIVAAVEGRIPVGAVFYGVDASAGLQRLFGERS